MRLNIKDTLYLENDQYLISTVSLVDNYETAVFSFMDGSIRMMTRQYDTAEAAKKGHAETVFLLKSKQLSLEDS